MTASITHGRALRYAKGSARGLLHHVLGHYQLLNTACGDTFWQAAHDVADEAAELEVEMRFRLRADLEGDAGLSLHNSGGF
jgi:hypothetical protein